MEVAYCPYRSIINHDWSTIKTTALTEPITFTPEVQSTKFPYQEENAEEVIDPENTGERHLTARFIKPHLEIADNVR